jgi:4-amino-4-deoxy-L-arabinose transferase-like glycosyltransferase
MTTDSRTRIALAALALAFVAAGLLFVPRLGIEADEALVGNGIYEYGAPLYSWHFGENEVPVMLSSYLGALKTWLVHPWLDLWGPGRTSLRFPAILAGAATLWLFFALLDRMHGRSAAWIGTLLLSTDPSFLLIEATDFGFVALQFVFKLSAILLLLRFHQDGRRWILAAAFFLFGLALWDKAVFLWVLGGLGFAALVAIPKELSRYGLRIGNIAIAAGSVILGALPLVIYNIVRPLETLRSNAKVAGEPVLGKAVILWRTLDGYVFFGFMTSQEPHQLTGAVRHWYQAASLQLSNWTRHPQHDLTLWALAACVIALPFLWRTSARKPMLFGLAASIATWFAMALTTGAGAAAQHVILLWPFPFLVIAVTLSYAPRVIGIILTTLLCLSNLAVTNNYYAELIRDGPAIHWTDAIDPLHIYLQSLHPDYVFIGDWGFVETLNLLSEGSLPVVAADTTDDAAIQNMFAAGQSVFVFHAAPYAFQPELRARIESAARNHGWEQQHLQTIYDQNGRPTFDVFRFRKVHL